MSAVAKPAKRSDKACEPMEQFVRVNAEYLRLWGAWIRLQPKKAWLACLLRLSDDGNEVLEISLLDESGYSKVEQSLPVQPAMRKSGYTHYWIVLVQWKGLTHCYEFDLINNGILSVPMTDSPLFVEAHKTIVPLLAANAGHNTATWYQETNNTKQDLPTFRLMNMPFEFKGFKDWLKKKHATPAAATTPTNAQSSTQSDKKE